MVTGVGMVATAFSMGRIVGDDAFDYAINAGIAGSFSNAFSPGDVVAVVRDCFSELGAADGLSFLSIDELGFGNSTLEPLPNEKLTACISSLKKASGITVNGVHGEDKSIQSTRERLNPDIETMEGAAFFYSCNQANIPAIQIRAISNYVERRDKSKWNIPLAIRTLNERLIKIYDTLQHI